ncbi:MAG: hypothetical protein CMN56_03090 [Sneathiella sp.]|uniref:hypothetical protein n=1 Tax=Sneathiella sp. TaxID=1964365 RepID=UPI000C4DA68B|nr:hypothetical protein [Sneathiella sp.]MAZ02103.1 hypothetical protein [Sneathiella sp.]
MSQKSTCYVYAVFAACLFLWPANVRAETDKECLAIWKNPDVKIEVVSKKPRLDHGKSSQQIEQIAKKSGFAKSLRHANLLGLTHSSIGPSLGVATKYKALEAGQNCLRLDWVKLTFGARKTNVYIDRKYRKSSCAYKAILKHEMEHVRINERVIEEYLPIITNELEERAAGVKPFYTKSPKDAGRSIVNRLMFELDPVLEEFNKARMAANDLIDTPAAYAETQAKCTDW